MDVLRRGMALGIGLGAGRMLYAILSVFLGLVTVVTIGLFLSRHWIIGSLIFFSGVVVHQGICRWLTRE